MLQYLVHHRVASVFALRTSNASKVSLLAWFTTESRTPVVSPGTRLISLLALLVQRYVLYQYKKYLKATRACGLLLAQTCLLYWYKKYLKATRAFVRWRRTRRAQSHAAPAPLCSRQYLRFCTSKSSEVMLLLAHASPAALHSASDGASSALLY